MGQYHLPVNLTKREFILPHRLGTGLKAAEQVGCHPGTGSALIVLLLHRSERGGGDLDLTENWHGPERDVEMASGKIDGCTSATMPHSYATIAQRTIGRWHGDRIALIGDYADDADLPDEITGGIPASLIYDLCRSEPPRTLDMLRLRGLLAEASERHGCDILGRSREAWLSAPDTAIPLFTDISADVAAVIEHELCGRYVGDGWLSWEPIPPPPPARKQRPSRRLT